MQQLATRSLIAFALALLLSACATPVGVRLVDRGRVRKVLSADAISADRPSISSRQVLLRLGWADRAHSDRENVLAELHTLTLAELDADPVTGAARLYALAEYSYLHAASLAEACKSPFERLTQRIRNRGRERRPPCDAAQAYYVAAAIYSYAFAFPDGGRFGPGPLDPRLRTAVDLYNLSITSAIRSPENLRERTHFELQFHLGTLVVDADPSDLNYADRRLGDFIPAAELQVRGLRNRYREPGVGAPFLARPIHDDDRKVPLKSARVVEQMRVPVTVFVRFSDAIEGLRSGQIEARLEIYTETRTSEIEVGGRRLPLEYETSSALAYTLERSKLWDFELAGFRHGDELPVADGLVMIEPYRPGKVPVVLVHGTASSPARWAEMLNEYRSDPVLRERCQFWLFMYATGNPVLYSASLLRESLRSVLAEIDPQDLDPALRDMVLVGHSQGGLLAKLQAIDSEGRFWRMIADTPIDDLDVQTSSRALLHRVFGFEALPFVSRVVFISTPHRGSFLAGNFLGRFASSLFTAPTQLLGLSVDLARAGVGLAGSAAQQAGSALRGGDEDERVHAELGRLPSSVDNMDPNNRFIQTIQQIPVDPRIRANSIIPVKGAAPPEGQNDGVVEYSSAHIDEAHSEYVVYHSQHSTQDHPETIQELRRILRAHVDEGVAP